MARTILTAQYFKLKIPDTHSRLGPVRHARAQRLERVESDTLAMEPDARR